MFGQERGGAGGQACEAGGGGARGESLRRLRVPAAGRRRGVTKWEKLTRGGALTADTGPRPRAAGAAALVSIRRRWLRLGSGRAARSDAGIWTVAVTVISPHQHGGTRDRRLDKMAPAATPSPGLKGRRDSSACRGPCPARRGRARRPLEDAARQSSSSAHAPAPPAEWRRRPYLTAGRAAPGVVGTGEADRDPLSFRASRPVRGESRFSLRDFASRRWAVTDVACRTGPIKPLSARSCRVAIRKRKTKTFVAEVMGKCTFSFKEEGSNFHHGQEADTAGLKELTLPNPITADGDCSREIKRHLLLGRKVMTNLDSILKSRDITLPTKVRLVKAMVFPVDVRVGL
ncbi:uncharacterized protein LOC129540091 [Moschus berezovskii]|uniref:uncharacterized protein LOC129540091 n=1 Tax=Moschus berezovskii TaxID=68408 RepID=UPI0024452CED|nr:uncharacterized protein LOC129540091 [Moschus berezovskii]